MTGSREGIITALPLQIKSDLRLTEPIDCTLASP